MADIKKILQETLEKAKKTKADEDSIRQQKNDSDRTAILKNVGGDLSKALGQMMPDLIKSAQISEETIKKALSEAIQVNMPGIELPQINIPDIQIDTTQLNAIAERIEKAVANLNLKEPKVTYTPQSIQFPERFNVSLPDVDRLKPMPVMMMDDKGRPFNFPQSNIGGGKADFLTIKDIKNSTGGSIIDNDGFVKVTGSVSVSATNNSTQAIDSSGNPYSTANPLPVTFTGAAGTSVSIVNSDGAYYNSDNPLPVTFSAASVQPISQVSGHEWSTVVNTIFGTTGTNVFNPDNRLKVELPTGSSGLTDTEIRATALPVSQLSGANWSVSVTDIFGSTGTGFFNLDNRLRMELPTYTQAISVTDIFATTATSNVVNPDNRVKVELPATTITAVTSITNTIAAASVDSSGVQYSGSNPLPITIAGDSTSLEVIQVSGAINSVFITGASGTTVVVGEIASDVADTESNPIKIGGIARTANPAAVAAGDRVSFTADDLGRQVTRPVQVRDLIQTAYVSVTNGTETTLRAAVAGAFLDLVMIVASNNSDAAVSVDIRPVTAGNIVNTLRIPANGTAGWTPPIPWPASDTGNNWTVDGPDETGRTLTFSALFSQEI